MKDRTENVCLQYQCLQTKWGVEEGWWKFAMRLNRVEPSRWNRKHEVGSGWKDYFSNSDTNTDANTDANAKTNTK